jgi:hypothetical protein
MYVPNYVMNVMFSYKCYDYTYMIFYNKHEKYNKFHCNRAKRSPNPMYPNNFLKNMKKIGIKT